MTRWLQYLESRSKQSLLAASSLLVVVVGVIDYLTGVELSFSILYLLPVALSAWLISRWAGVTISIISAIAWFLADLFSSVRYSSPVVPYWNATVMLGFFLSSALILSELRRTADRENGLAREIQKGLLPTVIPNISGFEIAGAWLPTQSVSGDYYDVLQLDDETLLLCVGDVVGHGIPAALLMSNLQAAVRLLAPIHRSPRDLCAKLNRFVIDNTTPGTLITFFCGVLYLTIREFVYTNAGHHRPILLHRGETMVDLGEGGIPLGFLSEARYNEGKTQIEDGDLLMIYTDGALETRNLRNEEFGEKRFLKILKENHMKGASATCTSILTALREFSKRNHQDDITLLALYAQEATNSLKEQR